MPDGQTVTLTLGSGSRAQSCEGQTEADGTVSCQIAMVKQPLGDQPVSASFNGDSYYSASSDTSQQSLVFSYLAGGGGFAIGDKAVRRRHAEPHVHLVGRQVGQVEPALGRGGAGQLQGLRPDVPETVQRTVADPVCGGTWTGQPTAAPRAEQRAGLHGRGGASKVTQSGSTISGNIAKIVIVKTNPGYQPDPGHPGTGTVVASVSQYLGAGSGRSGRRATLAGPSAGRSPVCRNDPRNRHQT